MSPGTALTLTIQVGEADDVDRLAERAAAAGGALDGPIDTPWGTRDFAIVDPDGIRYTLTGRGRHPVAVAESLGDFTEATS